MLISQTSISQTSEIVDSIKEPQIEKLYKGEIAGFDGALVPFNTFKRYEEFRYSYEKFREEYIKFGLTDNEKPSIKKDIGLYGMVFFAGALISASIANDHDLITGLSAVGLAGSIALLVW